MTELKKVSATVRGVHVSPQKLNLVAELIRAKKGRNYYAADALQLLRLCNKKSAFILHKLLKSAIANAGHQQAKVEELVVDSVIVGLFATQKRLIPRARGRADQMVRKYSQATIHLRRK